MRIGKTLVGSIQIDGCPIFNHYSVDYLDDNLCVFCKNPVTDVYPDAYFYRKNDVMVVLCKICFKKVKLLAGEYK